MIEIRNIVKFNDPNTFQSTIGISISVPLSDFERSKPEHIASQIAQLIVKHIEEQYDTFQHN